MTELKIGITSELGLTTKHRLFLGFDARDMSRVEDESVHLVVTSPPYWNLKDYGNPAQIGFRDELPQYFAKLNAVWKECIRVLKPGCRLCINIGDEYMRASQGTPYHIIPLHSHLVNEIMTKSSKDIIYLGSIIWNKIPTTKTSGGASVMGSYGRPRNGYVSYNYEYIAIFKKLGTPPPAPISAEQERIDIDEWRLLFNGTWTIHGARQVGGMAIFPDELPKRLIRMFTYKGDTVLDPFLGSGTTSRAAFEMGRNSIGFEIGFEAGNQDWKELIKEKVHYYDVSPVQQNQVFQLESKTPIRK